jgi:2-dehydropantoate 2-reductase
MKTMNILVIGAGAVGGVIAGVLTRKKIRVDVACDSADLAEKLRNEGLILTIRKRTRRIKLNAYPSVEATPGNYQFILLATKAHQMEVPALQALEKLAPTGLLVSLQDGFCEERLARLAGSNRVIGAILGWGATQHEPGFVEMTSKGEMLIGNLNGTDDKRLDELQYLLDFVTHTEVVSNIKEQVFSKLVINSCVTTLGLISGQKIGKLLLNIKARKIILKIIEEAVNVAQSLKIQIPDFAGRLNYYQIIQNNNKLNLLSNHLRILLFGLKYRNVKSSGLQSIERGEPSEIDVLNGHILLKSAETGMPTPVNQLLVKMVHEIEAGTRKICPQNLDEIFASIQC